MVSIEINKPAERIFDERGVEQVLITVKEESVKRLEVILDYLGLYEPKFKELSINDLLEILIFRMQRIRGELEHLKLRTFVERRAKDQQDALEEDLMTEHDWQLIDLYDANSPLFEQALAWFGGGESAY